ncbi:unnamed protein product [Clonostachys solani]|uniref:Methyltransferase domain-containing protein n=1 Tax=Clonostachys solani TaxID=160281 RepID=A0A9N9ZHQ2_9HYPO|nr:unnamed protein product [Clonostachys solani]
MLVLPNRYTDPKKYTNDLCEFISTPLIQQITGGIHVNDSLIYEAWESLPQDWTRYWSSWTDHRHLQQDLLDSIEDRAEFMTTESDEGHGELLHSRPEALVSWLQKLNSLALPRGEREGPSAELPDALTRRMKTKKVAEISKAAAYVHDICQRKGITRVVDMGSGQGYLSVSLAYLFPQLKILAIDGSDSQIVGSQEFATSIGIPESRLVHLVHWIDGSSNLAQRIEDWADGQKCMLVGLHACGNLSDHMLRYFTSMSCIETLGVIGCCYNHIIPRSPSYPEGFPTSSTLRKHNLTLSATALMTACQAPSNWERPDVQLATKGNSIFSRRRLYRAILEKALFDKGIKVAAEQRPAWGIRKSDMTDFTHFAHRAMDCLGISRAEITTEDLKKYEEKYRNYEGRIAILWTLSVLCCKVVESVIALDRYWYLEEQGLEQVEVFPIFDAKVSPRNLIVVAQKNKARS